MIGTSRSSSSRLARAWLVSALAASLASVAIVAIAAHGIPGPTEPCAPAFAPGTLSARDQGFVAQHVLACGDHARGDLTTAEYRERIAKLDAAWFARDPAPRPIQWASSVRGVSSQYTATLWSAAEALGAPDVYPKSGDVGQAWASLSADGGPEWIEVGYAQPVPVSAISILETLNPGAVTRVELITTSGARILAYDGVASPRGDAARDHRIDLACTAEPIAAVRLSLDSAAVAGWNEIDAIGLVPCATP